jgi:ubiquinone/menaquinone biosynthesis C-methylase UbiE
MEDKVSEQYTLWASTYDKDKVEIFARAGYSYEEFMVRFIKSCCLKAGMNILDVGSGTGLTAITIAKAVSGNCRIAGIEPVDAMIGKAKTNIKNEGLQDVILINKASAESVPSEDCVYDLVTCTFAMRHTNIEKALTEFARVLKPKGRIVVADIYAPEKWRNILGKLIAPLFQFAFRFGKYKAETISKVLTINEWRALLGRLGLTVTNIVEFPGKKEPDWEIGRAIISITK